jgi:hypothetical protein
MNMTTLIERASSIGKESAAASALWVGLVAGLSVAGSLAFACAAPLAAIAALAGAKMRAGEGVALVVAAWLANQMVGYAVLDYPQTLDSFAWGAAIGIASVIGFAAAREVVRPGMPELVTLAVALGAAFIAYEGTLFATTAVLSSSEEAFSLAVIGRIFAINAIAFTGLILLHRGAIALHVLRPAGRAPQPAAA